MHRLLIAFKKSTIVIYSMNKHQVIFQLVGKKALSCDWLPPKSAQFAVLTTAGFIEIFKSDSQVPVTVIDLKA